MKIKEIPRRPVKELTKEQYRRLWGRSWLLLILPIMYVYQLVGKHYEGSRQTFRGFNEEFFDELYTYVYALCTKKDIGTNPNLRKREVYRRCKVKRYGYHAFYEELYEHLMGCYQDLTLNTENQLVYNRDSEYKDHIIRIVKHPKEQKYAITYRLKFYYQSNKDYIREATNVTEKEVLEILQEGRRYL